MVRFGGRHVKEWQEEMRLESGAQLDRRHPLVSSSDPRNEPIRSELNFSRELVGAARAWQHVEGLRQAEGEHFYLAHRLLVRVFVLRCLAHQLVRLRLLTHQSAGRLEGKKPRSQEAAQSADGQNIELLEVRV